MTEAEWYRTNVPKIKKVIKKAGSITVPLKYIKTPIKKKRLGIK